MIDLERLVIKPGDVVRSTTSFFELESREFIVKDIKIVNFVQMVYPEVGPPIPANELIVVRKEKELTIESKNKAALTNILNNIYKDRWDIVPYLSENKSTKIGNLTVSGDIRTSFILLIHYPEIEIKNSQNDKHIIRDLFIALPLQNNYRFISGNIYGMRTTLTDAEQRSFYSHSHLHVSISWPNFNNFCLGRGIIRESHLICQGLDPSLDEFQYEMFFENLNSFVAWESIEGGPYQRMTNIKISSTRLSYGSSTIYDNEIVDIVLLMNLNNKKVPFNLDLKSFNILNIDELELTSIVKELIFNESNAATLTDGLIKKVVQYEDNTIQKEIRDFTKREFLEILNESKNPKTNGEDIVREMGFSNLLFKEEYVPRKLIIKSDTNSLNINNLNINRSLISSLIKNFKIKFYGEYYKLEDKFFEEVSNN